MVRKTLVHVLAQPRKIHSGQQDVIRWSGWRIRQSQLDCISQGKLMIGMILHKKHLKKFSSIFFFTLFGYHFLISINKPLRFKYNQISLPYLIDADSN